MPEFLCENKIILVFGQRPRGLSSGKTSPHKLVRFSPADRFFMMLVRRLTKGIDGATCVVRSEAEGQFVRRRESARFGSKWVSILKLWDFGYDQPELLPAAVTRRIAIRSLEPTASTNQKA